MFVCNYLMMAVFRVGNRIIQALLLLQGMVIKNTMAHQRQRPRRVVDLFWNCLGMKWTLNTFYQVINHEVSEAAALVGLLSRRCSTKWKGMRLPAISCQYGCHAAHPAVHFIPLLLHTDEYGELSAQLWICSRPTCVLYKYHIYRVHVGQKSFCEQRMNL